MKIKRLFIIMNIIVFAAIVFASVWTVAVGGRYSFYSNAYFDNSDIVSFSASFDNDSAVDLDDVYFSDENELIFDFSSVSSGDTRGIVAVAVQPNGGEDPVLHSFIVEFKVTNLGVIVDTTYETVNFSGYTGVLYTVFFILGVTFVFLTLIFFAYLKDGDFNYKMIACAGLAIFVGVLLAYLVYKRANHWLRFFDSFINEFLNIGYILFLLLTPVMLLISVLLAVSNIRLMKREGYRPVNSLGILFGILWTIATLIVFNVSILPLLNHDNGSIVKRTVLYITCYFGAMFIATVVCAFLAVRYRPPYDRDYIIILGCAIRSDGTLTPLLKGRVDAALKFEKEQFEKTGKHAIFVPSGGQGPDEVISESQAMTDYLKEQGVPGDRILMEDRSVNTMQNMQFSKEVIRNHAEDFSKCRIAFATTNYHIFRGYVLARKNGFVAKGISAKTRYYFFPNAFLREYIGLLVDRRYKNIAFIVITLIVFVLLNHFRQM